MKKLLTLFVTCALLLTGCGNGDANPKAVKIGVLQLMTHEALNAALQGFKDGMTELGYVEGEDVVYEVQMEKEIK